MSDVPDPSDTHTPEREAQLLDAIEDDLASSNDLSDGSRDYYMHGSDLLVDLYDDPVEPVVTSTYRVRITVERLESGR